MQPSSNHPVTVRWVLFGFKGRIGRKSFALAALLMILIQAAIIPQIINKPEDDPIATLWGFFLMVTWLASAWAAVALAVKRLHDLGIPGILAICLLIPAISVIAFLFLAAMPPSQATNEHGPPPFRKK